MGNNVHEQVEAIKRGIMAGQLDINTGMRWVQQLHAEAARKAAGEAEPPRLVVNYFLAKLTNGQLQLLARWADQVSRRAPHLADMLLGVLRAEAERRETETTDGCIPVEPSKADVSPMVDWSNAQIGSALIASSMPAAIEDDFEVGRFLDKLQLCLSVLAAARLTLSSGGNQ